MSNSKFRVIISKYQNANVQMEKLQSKSVLRYAIQDITSLTRNFKVRYSKFIFTVCVLYVLSCMYI